MLFSNIRLFLCRGDARKGTIETLVSFGEWVRRRREALAYTRPELADCVGCSVSALRKIEADERRPSRQLAELLAGCLQVANEEQPLFLEVARGVRQVARMGNPVRESVTPVSRVPSPTPRGSPGTAAPGGASWNLPAPATPLVGRQAELATLAELLDDPGCRLLTLVGPGGIGKTRLAIELACNVWSRFSGGVFFAPLAATNAPELIVPVVAHAIGLSLTGPGDPQQQLLSYLRDKHLLVLLDNVEHLLAGVDELSAWLAAAPGLKLLVTSRERLELSGEWVFEVQGLPVPTPGEAGDAGDYSGFHLFLQRAQRAKVDFELSEEERAAAVRICQLVEGMPLAIELAAAWIPVLSCTEIAAELEQGLDILATRLRDLPERQRSLRAVFDHSWQLLTAEEQAVMRQLSIFRAGFRREAAEAVAGATLDTLSALVASSFLRRTSKERYIPHELVRHYAGGRLAERAEEEEAAARGRHSAYYADYMAGLGEMLKGTRQLAALREIDAEIDNVRTGWTWAVKQRNTTMMAAFASSMMHFYQIRGWHEEAVQTCARAITMLDDAETREAVLLKARLQVHQAAAMEYLGQRLKARGLLQESLDCASRLGSQEDIAHALANLGSGAIFRGDAQEAMGYFQGALEIYEALDDTYGRVWSLQSLGWAALNIDDLELAQAFHRRSLPLLREHGPPSLLGWTLYELGAIRRESGVYDEASAYLEEARATCAAIGYHFALLSCLLGLGQTAEMVGRYGQAQSYYQEAVALRSHLGDLTDIAMGLALLTRVTLELGDELQADRFLQDLRLFAERGASVVAHGCYEYAAAEMARNRGNLEAAGAGYRQSITILQPTRRRSLTLLALLRLGQLHLHSGDDDRAETSFHDALRQAWVRSSIGHALSAIIGLSRVRARLHNTERAVELAALVQSHPASPWTARQQADGLLTEMAEAMPEAALAAAVQRGRVQPLESAVTGLLPDELDS